MVPGLMLTDLRQALRFLGSAPGFTGIVVVVLALGIGANTAIFSIVDGVLLQPLPFADASRLVAVESVSREEGEGASSFPDFADWKAQSTTLDRMAAYASGTVNLTGQGEPAALDAAFVTADLLSLLGARPVMGRTFTENDAERGAAGVAVISETLWEHRFSRDPSILGRAVTLDGQPFTVVGVLPAAFEFPIQASRVQVWVPINGIPFAAQLNQLRGAYYVHVVGHLGAGTSIRQAQAELAAVAGRLATAYPRSNASRTTHVLGLQDRLVHDYRLALLVLLCAVAIVLLIACANVANLLLVRGMARQREMAIRSALGASRGRLVKLLLTESVVLAVTAGALGLVLALWGVAALLALSPVDIPRLHAVRIDRSVLAFTTIVSLAIGLLFGLAPALQLSRSNAGETLKDARHGSSGTRSARTRQILVVAEVAMSLVLLAGAGLLVRSLVRLQHVDPGFVVEHAIAIEVSLPDTRYPNAAARVAFYRRLLDQLRTLPGSAAGAVASSLPLSGSDMGIGFTVEGQLNADPKAHLSAPYFAVSPDYFKTMGIGLVKGRAFTDRDGEDAPNVAIVSETMAKRYWPNQDPVGQRLTMGINNSGPREIVGIVRDVKGAELREQAQPQMYAPFAQTPWPFLSAVVRTEADPASAGGALRAALVAIDRDQPPGEVKTFAQYVSRAIAEPRFNALLVGSFATLALLLAGFGLYGVMAYSVAQRSREIGIRLALGAQPSDVRALVVGQACRLGGIGIGLGLAGALLATRVIGDLLFGVGPNDPATFAAVSGLLLAVLLAGAYLPARRATRMDPMVALRTD